MIPDLIVEVPVIIDRRVEVAVPCFGPTRRASSRTVRIHHDELILIGVSPEDPDLRSTSVQAVDVSIDEINSNFNDLADWQDPNGDKLILGVIGQVCRVEN